MLLRLSLAAVSLAALHLTAWITWSGALPHDVPLPNPDMRSLPRQLGEWIGEDKELDPRIAKATGGEYTVNRQYRGPDGNIVSLHLVVITNYSEEGVHHFPQYCLRGAGYEQQSVKRRPIQTANGYEIPVSFSLWNRKDETSAVAYWYHFGDDTLFDINDFRRAHWGSDDWPPCVKILLQTPAGFSTEIPSHLEDFAKLVAGWTCENLRGQGAGGPQANDQ